VVVASRWEPSSKTCSGCGWVDAELALGERTFHCRNPQGPCGLVLDRDLNAAINLAQLADSSPDNANACGEGSAGAGRTAGVKLPSVKQEPNTV
jgi:putative transposase